MKTLNLFFLIFFITTLSPCQSNNEQELNQITTQHSLDSRTLRMI